MSDAAATWLESVRLAASPVEALGPWLQTQRYSRLAVVVDATVWQLHGQGIRALLPADAVISPIPPGEVNKTLSTCQQLWDDWYAQALDRNSLVLAIGGGMTTDLGAFAASCWKRGLRFALVPTTLLAMVDATLGGKTGIDYHTGKNLIGSFAQPEAICIATDFLHTLDARELRSGWAEVLKHALLFDAEEWQRLLGMNPTSGDVDWQAVIRRSLAFKAAVVAEDPLERGPRALLNLGHTLGHAIESALLGTVQELRHGEALAIGLALEAELAQTYTGLPAADYHAVVDGLARVGYRLQLPPIDAQQLAALLRHDKKNDTRSGADVLRMVLLSRIGAARVGVEVPVSAALEVCLRAMSAAPLSSDLRP